MGPRRDQGVGRAWGVWPLWVPPAGALLALSLFLHENNSCKIVDDSEKLSRTTFLKQKDSRKQELALASC